MISLDGASTSGLLAEEASSFLSESVSAFPAATEGVAGVQPHTLCIHEDPEAATWPLYALSSGGVVAQVGGSLLRRPPAACPARPCACRLC